MTWLTRLLAHFRLTSLSEIPRAQRVKEERLKAEADKVVEDFRRFDGALHIVVVRKPK